MFWLDLPETQVYVTLNKAAHKKNNKKWAYIFQNHSVYRSATGNASEVCLLIL